MGEEARELAAAGSFCCAYVAARAASQLCASDVSLSTSPGGVSVRILPHAVTAKVGQNEDERKLGEAALQARRTQPRHQLKLHRNFGSVVAVRGVLAAVALARW